MDARGRVLTPLDEDALRAAIIQLRDDGCEALVIHFLHAYANPAHELRAGEIARELWPNPYITLGHALLSESREYERGVTAAVNASVQPLLERYVARLADQLAAKGYARDLLVMNGNGGMVSARDVGREAVKTVMSGPASGVMAAVATGRRAGLLNLLTYDMGGTSTDVAMIRNGVAPVSNEIEVEYAMPIHVPMVDVRTVGAGGGHRPDRRGRHAAGRAGKCRIDAGANLLRARRHPRYHLGREPDPWPPARQPLRPGGTGRASGDAGPDRQPPWPVSGAGGRGGDPHRQHPYGRGDPHGLHLPRRRSARLCAFRLRRCGPLHAAALAKELNVPKVLIPARPGITNALGCVVADLRHDFVRTLNRPLDTVDMADVHAVLAGQEAEGRRLIGLEKIALTTTRAEYSADMQFIGQTHLLRVPCRMPPPAAKTSSAGSRPPITPASASICRRSGRTL
jgi:N-methylhydantoinase A